MVHCVSTIKMYDRYAENWTDGDVDLNYVIIENERHVHNH